MDPFASNERQLIADIEQLRDKFPNTQALYREVCTVMFFRYGITPTANKLYQYVKKGSMSAPAEALAKFWENLRDKSRVRIEHPDLPEDVKTRAGELAATLWDLAQDKAKASLREYEAEARASVMAAKAALARAESQRDALRAENARAQSDLAQARGQVSGLQQQLAAEGAARERLEMQLAQAHADITAHRQANETARQYFAAEIEKLRSESQLAEERYRAAEKRALLEIDRERSTAARAQKDLDVARAEAARQRDQYRLETQALQQQIGDMRQQVGMFEGQLQAAKTNSERSMHDLQDAQGRFTEASMRLASLESECAALRLRAEEAETEVRELKKRTAKRPVARKARGAPPAG
jgi:chromosome segregation ATPase